MAALSSLWVSCGSGEPCLAELDASVPVEPAAECSPDLSYIDDLFEPLPRTGPELDPDTVPRMDRASFSTVVHFPAGRSTFLSYWRGPSEDVSMTVHSIVGTEPSGESTGVFSFFVNGSPVNVLDSSGAAQAALEVHTLEGRASTEVVLEGSRFATGMNTVHLVEHWSYDDFPDYVPTVRVGKVFVVFSESERATDGLPDPSAGLTECARASAGPSYLWSDSPDVARRVLPEPPSELSLSIQSASGIVECAGIDDRIAVVVLRNGIPVAWPSGEEAIVAEINSTLLRHDARVSLPEIDPSDPGPYRFHVMALASIGLPLEDAAGQPTQWFTSSRLLGRSDRLSPPE